MDAALDRAQRQVQLPGDLLVAVSLKMEQEGNAVLRAQLLDKPRQLLDQDVALTLIGYLDLTLVEVVGVFRTVVQYRAPPALPVLIDEGILHDGG